MTKKEVIALCTQVLLMPFCQLEYTSMEDGILKTMTLTRRQYDVEMFKNRPWCTPWGDEAWYDDETSERLQDAWYATARKARQAVMEWEASYLGKIPQRVKSFRRKVDGEYSY